ncbi:hypothetical protein RB653_000394 [Dictyostelium firmibasis]|uniref:Uncharacterized protein n=1 Tax=Dictyostelium firmibasis TaxID=79012 RepID=A0AAN7U5X1_9MYCE
MHFNKFMFSFIRYLINVWCITLVFKFIEDSISDVQGKIKFKNFFFIFDFILSLFPFLSLIYLLLHSYTNALLFIEIILEKRFQFPNVLMVLFPIFYSLIGIFIYCHRFKSIKKNTIYFENNKEKNGSKLKIVEKVKVHSYGREFNKIKFTIITLLWFLFCNYYYFEPIDCELLEQYKDLINNLKNSDINFCLGNTNRDSLDSRLDLVNFLSQTLPLTLIIPVMEISMIL